VTESGGKTGERLGVSPAADSWGRRKAHPRWDVDGGPSRFLRRGTSGRVTPPSPSGSLAQDVLPTSPSHKQRRADLLLGGQPEPVARGDWPPSHSRGEPALSRRGQHLSSVFGGRRLIPAERQPYKTQVDGGSRRRVYPTDRTQERRAKRFQKRFKARRATLLAQRSGEQPVESLKGATARFWERTGKP
jgi:hypothetical protein